jgi:hypothetical protein
MLNIERKRNNFQFQYSFLSMDSDDRNFKYIFNIFYNALLYLNTPFLFHRINKVDLTNQILVISIALYTSQFIFKVLAPSINIQDP